MKTIMFLSFLLSSVLLWAGGPSMDDIHAQIPRLLKGEAPQVAAPQYLTASAETGDIVRTIMATGTLNASVNVEVGSQLSGQIAKLLVDFNDKVKKGQPLAELDRASFVARVNEASAALEGARIGVRIAEAHVERALVDLRSSEIQRDMAVARWDNAKILYETSVKEAQRKTFLNQRGAAAGNDVIDAVARRESAANAVRESESGVTGQQIAIDGARADLKRASAELDSARGRVTQMEAQLRSATIDLDRTTIRSPVDGVVVGRTITEGQTLASGLEAKTLFLIAGDLRHMDVYARVDESDIGKISTGQKATFTVDAFPGRTFEATVRQVRKAPQVIQNVVTYTVVLTTDNSDGTLLPGMTSLARIEISHTPNALTVPMAALRYRPDHSRASESGLPGTEVPIWVLAANGQAKRVSVVTGEDDGNRVAITSGDLQPDDRIIVGSVDVPQEKSFLGYKVGL